MSGHLHRLRKLREFSDASQFKSSISPGDPAMSSAASRALELLNSRINVEEPPGEYLTVDQPRINAFAETTLDRQFIHIDPARSAAESPYGTTIAHGFLSLSLMT